MASPQHAAGRLEDQLVMVRLSSPYWRSPATGCACCARWPTPSGAALSSKADDSYA